MTLGIHRLSFHTPAYYLDLDTLAQARGADPAKFHVGLGQDRMAIPPPDQDIVTLAANAALPILDELGPDHIDWCLFATESGVDQSKAAALFCHGLLGLPASCRCAEIKEACYGGTAALRLAAAIVAASPASRVLVLASDIARYDLASPGEPTQGAGAVAMLVAADPDLLVLEPSPGVHCEDIMDFWRPNYRTEALAEGHYSTRMYLTTLAEAYKAHQAATGHTLATFAHLACHMPFTRIAWKALARLARADGIPEPPPDAADALLAPATLYNRLTGNTYAACLYEGLASLLDHAPAPLDGKTIGCFSYGSGCMAEFYAATVVPGYAAHLYTPLHRHLLADRVPLTYRQYEDIFQYGIPTDGADHIFAPYRGGPFRLATLSAHKRRYERRDP